jgi:hypothetical protein
MIDLERPKIPLAKVYLTRRNLLALLSKLDRDAAGEETACAIIKHKNDVPAYQQTMNSIMVIAVQDEDYYNALARPAGVMHPSDEAKLPKPSLGTEFGATDSPVRS